MYTDISLNIFTTITRVRIVWDFVGFFMTYSISIFKNNICILTMNEFNDFKASILHFCNFKTIFHTFIKSENFFWFFYFHLCSKNVFT